MTLVPKIDQTEFQLIQSYIETHCGIHITSDKKYLIETRLTSLMVENGCRTFIELYQKATKDKTNTLRNKIIDAMTTNETLWFRDMTPFTILEEILLPQYSQEIKEGKRSKIKIWSTSCSTGQEPYSIAMTANEYAAKRNMLRMDQVEITATDISPTVVYLATAARYDNIAINRGLSDYYRTKYFSMDGKVWVLKPEIKNHVTFRRFNLQDMFIGLGKFDIIFCRNVLIYFSDDFKREILKKISEVLNPDGYLFLGASESIVNYSSLYRMLNHNRGLYYKLKSESVSPKL